jgi:hypothetical protein
MKSSDNSMMRLLVSSSEGIRKTSLKNLKSRERNDQNSFLFVALAYFNRLKKECLG